MLNNFSYYTKEDYNQSSKIFLSANSASGIWGKKASQISDKSESKQIMQSYFQNSKYE